MSIHERYCKARFDLCAWTMATLLEGSKCHHVPSTRLPMANNSYSFFLSFFLRSYPNRYRVFLNGHRCSKHGRQGFILPSIIQESKQQSIDSYYLAKSLCGCLFLRRKEALHFSINSWSSILADLINILRLSIVVFRPYVAAFLLGLAVMG